MNNEYSLFTKKIFFYLVFVFFISLPYIVVAQTCSDTDGADYPPGDDVPPPSTFYTHGRAIKGSTVLKDRCPSENGPIIDEAFCSNTNNAYYLNGAPCGSGYKCVTEAFSLEAWCVRTCTDDCTSGSRRCSGNGYQTCGNYDADVCFEWSSVTNCAAGQTCGNGNCIDSCIDSDNSFNPPTFNDPSLLTAGRTTVGASVTSDRCPDTIAEVVERYCNTPSSATQTSIRCPSGYVCALTGNNEGRCVLECLHGCGPVGTRECYQNGYRVCGNCDPDICLEWCITNCPSGYTCSNGECVSNPVCTDGICNGAETCSTCPQDCGSCGDPCAGINCGNPQCIDANTLNIPYCSGGNCFFTTQTCAYGCNINACNQDPCVGITCDDGNECTQNACSNGICQYPNSPEGTPCSIGICDGAGQCVPISEPCTFSSAYWSKNTAVEGEVVSSIVEGSNCEGKLVDFNVFENDGALGSEPARSNPPSVSFVSGSATTFWNAEFQCDGDILGVCTFGNPEYYFIATLQEDHSVNLTSGDLVISQNIVNQDCGNGRLEAGEVCDVNDPGNSGDDILPGGKNDCSDHTDEQHNGQYKWTGGKLRCDPTCFIIDTNDCICEGCS